ncbi:hypothetical protein CTAYLR_000447 [Chrysophaeum taylorii]|uniref:GST N-terminal domain-containing protein n=1 Tax=Chrysophaeum taylorii TaxID=2483200 RepID=A0AAD7XJU0_9STRA|nr:hypothetical protein CTAYLR_000447 [Chrysophaeum taylorii]
MLHLYHIPRFRSTRVVWLVAELAQHYALPPITIHEFRDVALFRNKKEDWFLELNPNGKIPVFVDETKTLWEGGAIVLSLLDTLDKDKKLLTDEQRDLFYQLAFYCAGTVDNLSAASSPIQRAVMAHADGAPASMDPTVDPVRKTAWAEIVAPFLEGVIARTDGAHLAGPDFSAADLFVGLTLFAVDERMSLRGAGSSWIDAAKTPRLRTLADLLQARPARAFAFEATLNRPESLALHSEFGIVDWIPATKPFFS